MRVVFRGRAKFLSTPSARRATTFSPAIIPLPPISIHALREEGDCGGFGVGCRLQIISIHALCEEGDHLPSKNAT